MASFTVFPRLPVELQLKIWDLSIPDPEPEVCIAWPLNLQADLEDQPALPFTVDTAWPAAAHVCRTAREAVFSSKRLRLRHSRIAGFVVPYRAFDPAIDTLYWAEPQARAMRRFFRNPKNAALGRALRHIAVTADVLYPPSALAEFIRKDAVFLRTLSVVFPVSSDRQDATTNFHPPARRCRLRDIPSGAAEKLTLTNVPFEVGTQTVQEFLDARREEMDEHVRSFQVAGDDSGTAWRSVDESFSGVEFKAQTFVEYTTAEGRGAQWVEPCGRRLLGVEGRIAWPRYISPADRKNPDEYRVLDDDCDLEVPKYVPGPAEYEMELAWR